MFKKLILISLPILSLAFLLNLIWELSQMPLYAGGSYLADHLAQSLYATFWDAAMTLGIYFIVAIVKRNIFWLEKINASEIFFAAGLGLALAIFIEVRALQEGRWGYSALMPIIRFLKVGLSPILQMVILPSASFILAAKFLRKYRLIY